MKKELSFITVIGLDKKGIVATISNLLYKRDVNIEDIAQQVMEKLAMYYLMLFVFIYIDTTEPIAKLTSANPRRGSSFESH